MLDQQDRYLWFVTFLI